MNLEEILGTRNRVRVLRALYLRDGLSGRGVARAAGVAPSAAKETLDELVAAGLAFRVGDGRRICYELNRSHYLTSSLDALFARERALPGDLVRFLRRRLQAMTPPNDLRALAMGDGGGLELLLTGPWGDGAGVEAALARPVKASFGLGSVAVATPADPIRGRVVWSQALPEPLPPRAGDAAARALAFFGLPPSGAEGPQQEDRP